MGEWLPGQTRWGASKRKGPTQARSKNPFHRDRKFEEAYRAKRSWDLPTDCDAFLSVVGMSVTQFMTLPAARAMPARLKAELTQRGML